MIADKLAEALRTTLRAVNEDAEVLRWNGADKALTDAESALAEYDAQSQVPPAPWSMDPEGAVAIGIEAADGTLVCHVYGNTPEVREATAGCIVACVNAYAGRSPA